MDCFTGIDIGVARDKLAGFQSADELAGFLMDEGIKGRRQMSNSCAIAVWMKKTTGVSVGVSMTELWEDHYTPRVQPIKHNEVLKDFVVKFDNHQYPELEDY